MYRSVVPNNIQSFPICLLPAYELIVCVNLFVKYLKEKTFPCHARLTCRKTVSAISETKELIVYSFVYYKYRYPPFGISFYLERINKL